MSAAAAIERGIAACGVLARARARVAATGVRLDPAATLLARDADRR
ncbi:MAG: hypothetical protein WEB51_05900 [Mycobacterium sp.]